MFPIGCSAFRIRYLGNSCFLSAGHCFSSSPSLRVDFNVPLSTSTGTRQYPSPDDQYAVDPSANQYNSCDWWYFGVFRNPNTGKYPYEAYGVDFQIETFPPPTPCPPPSTTLRVTGYGQDDLPLQYNHVQQTDTGPYLDCFWFGGCGAGDRGTKANVIARVGNSGSPMISETSGKAIGIQVSAGSCSPWSSSSYVMSNATLQSAISNPLQVCIPFRRGDANDDGQVNLADVSFIGSYVYSGGQAPHCLESADGNDDGLMNVADMSYIANWYASGTPEPPAPGPFVCGPERGGLVGLGLPYWGCALYLSCF
jgi:hypothetical protein